MRGAKSRGRPPRPDVADMATSLESLGEHWRAKAADLRRYGASPSADALIQAASELEAVLMERESESLSLADAAAESGYSADHLARLIREGVISNAGRKHAPRIRRRDLPKKSAALRHTPLFGMIDRAQIARSVVSAHREDTI